MPNKIDIQKVTWDTPDPSQISWDDAKPKKRGIPDSKAADVLGAIGSFVTTPLRQIGEGVAGIGAAAGALAGGGNIDTALAAGTEAIGNKEAAWGYKPKTSAGKSAQTAMEYPFQKYAEAQDWAENVSDKLFPNAAANESPEAKALRRVQGDIIPFMVTHKDALDYGKADQPAIAKDVLNRREISDRGVVEQGAIQPELIKWDSEPVVAPTERALLYENIRQNRDSRIAERQAYKDAKATENWYQAENDLAQRVADAREDFSKREAHFQLGEGGEPIPYLADKGKPAIAVEPTPPVVEAPKQLPYKGMDRINESRSAFELDAQRLANEIAAARVDRRDAIRNEQLGRFDHEPLSGPTIVTARDSMVAMGKEKPVIKGTVGEVLDMIRKGEITSKDHETLYPNGVRNPNSVAYIFDKNTLGKDISTAKKEVVKGGAVESKWLGYPDRTEVPISDRTTVAVTKDGTVLTDPVTIKEASVAKDVAYAAEGKPKAAVTKATKVAKEIQSKSAIPSIAKEDAIVAKQEVVKQLATEKNPDRQMQLEIQLDQYNKIISGENGYKDFQAPEVGTTIPEEPKTLPESNMDVVEPTVEAGPTPEELKQIDNELPTDASVDSLIQAAVPKVDYGVGRERKSAAQARLDRIKAVAEAKALEAERAPLENAELYAGIPLNKLPKALNEVVVGTTKGLVNLTNAIIPATPKIKGMDLISLPQRIAASGKYPTYTKLYNDVYRLWEEDRTSIVNDLYKEVASDNPYDTRLSAKDLRKQHNALNKDEKLDLIRLLKHSEQSGHFYIADELLSNENPFGRAVSENVAKVYDSTRKFVFDVAMEDLKQNVKDALEGFKGQTWFDALKEWVDNEYTRADIEQLEVQTGKMVHGDALKALDTVNKVIEHNKEVLESYADNPEYLPHVRPSGEYAVRVFELDPETGERVKTFDGKDKEIYMRTAFNEAERRGLAHRVKTDPRNEIEGFPTNYERMLSERGTDKLVEGVDYEVVEDRIYPTNEEIWIYAGNMPAKVSLMESVINDLVAGKKMTSDLATKLEDSLSKVITEKQLSRGFGRHKLARQQHLIEGFDIEDPVGLVLNHARTMAGYHTKARYAISAAKLFKDASYDEHVLLNSFLQDTLSNENQAMAKSGAMVRQMLVLTQLAFRPIAPMINLTQMFTWGAPEMAARLKREGIEFKGSADGKIVQAGLDIMRQAGHELMNSGKGQTANLTKYFTPMERKAIDDFSRTGAAEAQNIREVSGLGEGVAARGLTKITAAGMTPFSMSEVLNREATFLATFREYSKAGVVYAEAFERAKNLSLEVNIDASKHNNPGVVRKGGPMAKTVYTFGRYSHSYLSWLFQQAAVHGDIKPAVRSLLVISALGGATALPMFNEVNSVAEKVFGKSFRLDMIKYLREHGQKTGSPRLTDTIEDTVMNGIASSVFKVDVSRGLAPSVPILSSILTDGSIDKATVGPISSVVTRTQRMSQAMSRGDKLRAIENIPVLPMGLANSVSAYRQYTKGATTAQGKPIRGTDNRPLKMTLDEALEKAIIGATPARIGREQNIAGSQYNLQEKYQDKLKDLRSRWMNDPASRGEIKQELHELKQQVKEYGIPIEVPRRFEKWDKPTRAEKRGKAIYRRGE